jgi:hypothetical protein
MISLTALLLPALASAVLIFLVSSAIHMATPWHAGDFNRLPNEDGVLAALRPFSLAPGQYAGPRPANMKDMGSPEFKAKVKLGPSIMLSVMPGIPGKSAARSIGSELGRQVLRGLLGSVLGGKRR